MPLVLDDEAAVLAARAVDWYVKEGVPDERIRAVAFGDSKDPEIEALKDLRSRLREAAADKVVIGTHAFEMLRQVRWDDAEVLGSLNSATRRSTRVHLRVPREVAALFEQTLRDAAEESLADGEVLAARRFRRASEQFASIHHHREESVA